MNPTPPKFKISWGSFWRALLLAVVVGAGTSFFLAWPNLSRKTYERLRSENDERIICFCYSNVSYEVQIIWTIVNKVFRLPVCPNFLIIPSHGPGGSSSRTSMPEMPDPALEPPPLPAPPTALTIEQCRGDEMMAKYKTAALSGIGVAAATFALMMLLGRAAANQRASKT